MLDKSSEAYGEKGYKLGNHLFHTPDSADFKTKRSVSAVSRLERSESGAIGELTHAWASSLHPELPRGAMGFWAIAPSGR